MLDLIILRLFDKIIIVSDRLKLDIKKAMIPDTKIQVIYNGINPAKFNFIGDNRIIKERLAIPLHYKVVGIVGRLAKEKGHIYFLQAAKYILREYGDVYFLIIGDGPLRRNLEITAKKMCITDKVAFTGYQENPMEFLSLVDIFVVSSKNEGLPLSLLEAMAMKKAVVAFGVGAIPQVLEDGLSGIIVKPGDWRSLAINILNLLKNDKKRSDFGENSRRIIEEKYTDSRMVNSLETVYENL
jgi:glycosyltransferase involved in cell wall biosynthesis